MTEIKLYKTPWKALRLMALTTPFVAGGIWLVTKNNGTNRNDLVSWGSIVFFGLAFLVGLFNLFDRRPQIIINQNGVWDRTTNQDEIEWDQVKSAYPINIAGQKFISLVVDDNFVFKNKEYKWAARTRQLSKAQRLNLSLGQLTIDDKKFTGFINKMIAATPTDRNTIITEYFG